jgi:16S rRNA G1207 methylase RsmC
MSHYYDTNQSSSADERQITVRVAGLTKTFFVASGLFSKDHLDTATKLLIEHADLRGAKQILDLGCGWGPVACVMRLLFDDIEVTAVDSSLRAIEYTKKNAHHHKIPIDVKKNDICEGLGMFDVILTNPPYSAGREVCYAFIEQSFAHLNPKGSLQLVARHQKGGKMLQQKMEEVFGNVEVLAKGSGFRVYCSRKN